MEVAKMQKSLTELHAKLGDPHTRGTSVQFGARNDHLRYAFVTWDCTVDGREADSAAVASGCGSRCVAYNIVPYENDVFPDDNWTLYPCAMHEKTF